jgi:hypothetical protein
MKRDQYYYLDIPLPPSPAHKARPQGGITTTSMYLPFYNVAFLIAAYYQSKTFLYPKKDRPKIWGDLLN